MKGTMLARRSRVGAARYLTFLAVAVAAAGCGRPPLVRAGRLSVADGFAYPSAGSAAAAYLTLRNEGTEADTLVGVRVPSAASVMLHQTEITGGMSSMHHLEQLVLEPGGIVRMVPGGLHLMVAGLTGPLVPGDSCRVELRFARAGVVRLAVPVVPFGTHTEARSAR